MSNQEFLKYLINEELYLVQDKLQPKESNDPIETANIVADPTPINEIKRQPIPLLIFTTFNDSNEQQLLQKVLEAVGHQLNQTTVIKPNESHNYSPKKTIIFTDDTQADFTYYQVISTEDGELLYSKSLRTLMSSVEDKKSLWTSLKTWFEIKS